MSTDHHSEDYVEPAERDPQAPTDFICIYPGCGELVLASVSWSASIRLRMCPTHAREYGAIKLEPVKDNLFLDHWLTDEGTRYGKDDPPKAVCVPNTRKTDH